MNAFEYLKTLHEVCQFQTREGAKIGLASNSELRRWLRNGVLVMNGRKVGEQDALPYPITSVYLFPKHRVTLL